MEIHKSELLHKGIVFDMSGAASMAVVSCYHVLLYVYVVYIEKYMKDGTKMLELLQRLKSKFNGKNLFFIRNSPFWFV